MSVTPQAVIEWCARLIEKTPDFPELSQCLVKIPELESLGDLPAGTRVLVRGDTDVVVNDDGTIGDEDDVRLRSLLGTLEFGLERGWVQIVYGHRGREPELSLEPIAKHLQKLLQERGHKGLQAKFVVTVV